MSKATPLPTETVDPPAGRALYLQDEHAWIAEQIAALTDGQLNRLDRADLIEYLTEMTIRDRREPRSRLDVLLHHLLKLQVQPEKLMGSSIAAILEQQSEIRCLIDSIPSLGRQAEIIAAAAYSDAIRRAARDTGLPAARFPAASPWTVEAALTLDPPEPAASGQRHR
jgi:hypothetical protein